MMYLLSSINFISKKAFITYDALLSTIPIMFLLLFIIQTIAFINNDGVYALQKRELFNFLVAVADHTVKKSDAVVKDSLDNPQPNLIDEDRLSLVEEKINKGVENIKIEITLDSPSVDYHTCIYRLVVDKQMKIRKLYVCGDYAYH